MMRGLPEKKPIAGVRHTIAVASGKGGVGKSTMAVNLAIALSLLGKRVGLLDADIYGPSLPTMMNLRGPPEADFDKKMLRPLVNYGISCMSMGFLLDEGSAVVWRGLMIMKALEQLIRQVDWSGNDILVIDMPPGTGDTQLTITQQIPLAGAVIVSTPQDIALLDAKKGIDMFNKVQVPILGLIQNMSMFECPNCHHQTHIFGEGGVKDTAVRLGVPFLGDVPLHREIMEGADKGRPVTVTDPHSKYAQTFMDIGKVLLERLDY
ncbi:P-loop containing nucleoside triphosphate hydrolase protein [Gonapodya prolifera JEL478]|uniref:Nucleotide-binding protein-like n=1 Tax=Gonapodya prolifera (strain JEL478) TaxID=1344416 RepID=A0A139AT82_GONPJ|nr:P-loop containing nucleoside triphosphate hydrolase protein [Gonapodya prolifera JEL478]|eukprot:KXS19894.1 P-loop containing nucleoside triphosphate hydrolase protein [Gonapodya prolifera JEL478]